MSTKYNKMWEEFSNKDSWREYILPKRTNDGFFNEGKLQAIELIKMVPKFNSVLEFGCGIGRVLTNLNADKKYGVDVCQAFLDKIEDDTITKIKSDGLNFNGVEEKSVEFIYSLMVFQHTDKKDHLHKLKKLYGLLKEGGTMLIQFPQNPNKYYKQTEFVNIYTKKELETLCIDSSIENYKIVEGNLVGYGDGLTSPSSDNREFFLIINK